MAARDPGIDAQNALAARVALSPALLATPAETRAGWRDLLARARAVPGVASAALSDIIPMREGENSVSYWSTPVEPPADQEPVALESTVTPDYRQVMGIPLRAGRFLAESDTSGNPQVVVIDENLARHAFGDAEAAVGKRLWVPALGSDPVRVVGVVGHVRHWGLSGDDTSPVRDQIYAAFAQLPDQILPTYSSFMSIAIRTSAGSASVMEPLQRALGGAAGDQALYDVRTMPELVSASLDRERFLVLLFGIFAGVALLLAGIGIYGVLAYLTNQRVPEIGIRMALGATGRDVVRFVVRESAGMILAGAAIGLVAALGAERVVERLVAGAKPNETLTVVLMMTVLMAAALFATLLPARWASRIDPIRALRRE
jgi:predicted permease